MDNAHPHALSDALLMDRYEPPPGAVVVMSPSGRTANDATGYSQAAAAMALADAQCDGYLGMDSARDADGIGIIVSWRRDPKHALVREQGRAIWYGWYRVVSRESRTRLCMGAFHAMKRAVTAF